MYKVLVVDDDPTILMFITRLLQKKFSCRVVTAENGLEGLSKVKEEKPEVIFLDVTMPVMSGVEMLNALKNDKEHSNIPVIMLTAVKDAALIREVTSKGVIAYLLKPLMLEPTTDKIREVFYKIRKTQGGPTQTAQSNFRIDKLYKNKMLIVESDPELKFALKEQMKEKFDVFDTADGAEGLEIFMKEKPKLVCLGEKLSVLNEKLLAQKLRSIQGAEKITILAIRNDVKMSEDEKELFDMVIPRNGKTEINLP